MGKDIGMCGKGKGMRGKHRNVGKGIGMCGDA